MNRHLRALAVIAPVFVLDRLTKVYIRENVSPLDTIPVIPGVFNIVHAENPGAAFSILADAPQTIRRAILIAASSVVMIAVAFLLFRSKPNPDETKVTPIALALVLGGALGNLWDRIAVGTVTDFLQVFLGSYEYPSFNVADSAVFIGACLLILDLWRGKKSAGALGA
ncbi:MAG: signal peptidase II [Acidobacteriota bacterium]